MADAFQNPTPLANEYWNQAVHKFVVGVWEQVQAGQLGGGGGLAIPSGQTSVALTYYGSTNNIQTATYGDGTVVTMTYVGGGAADDDRLQTVTVS